jgi:lactate dehydrogenase-like 2-hydroxyacid dehydrogenase
MTDRPRVVITRRLPEAVEAAVSERFDAVRSLDDHQMTAEELQRALGEADGILATVTDRFTGEVLAAYPLRTRIIASFGVGVDNIDLLAAAAHDIAVTNTPDVLTDATADLTIALMLMVTRRLGEAERALRGGRWRGWGPTYLLGRELSGKTLGIVGFGRIGRAVARRASRGFDMRVLCCTPRTPDESVLAEYGAECAPSLEELLGQSDIVSLHAPSTPGTRGLMNALRVAEMRPGSVLINTARGDLIDDDALIAALMSGHLAGAGLDVFRGEPNIDPRYLGMENVVLLPHIGSATRETREAMGMRALENLTAFFGGEPPRDRVA